MFFTVLFVAIIAAIIFASIFVNNSNYLDSSINPTLNVMKYMGYDKPLSKDEILKLNKLIIPHLSLSSRIRLIYSESDRLEGKLNEKAAAAAAAAAAPEIQTTHGNKPE